VEINIPLIKYSINNTWIIGEGTSLTMMLPPTLGISLYVDYKYAGSKARLSVSDYYSNIKDKFPVDEYLSINALPGGIKLVSFFR
jgi:hypothetical protein